MPTISMQIANQIKNALMVGKQEQRQVFERMVRVIRAKLGRANPGRAGTVKNLRGIDCPKEGWRATALQPLLETNLGKGLGHLRGTRLLPRERSSAAL